MQDHQVSTRHYHGVSPCQSYSVGRGLTLLPNMEPDLPTCIPVSRTRRLVLVAWRRCHSNRKTSIHPNMLTYIPT